MGPAKVMKDNTWLKVQNNSEDNQKLDSIRENIGKIKDSLMELKPCPLLKRKALAITVKNEYSFISSLFNFLELANLKYGRRNVEEEDNESIQILNLPEKKIFKKQTAKKGANQASSKSKPFPHSVDGLEKELEELKGTPMTYQKKLRKKGLQSRLIKKKRKENIKLQKALLKQGKKINTTVNGSSKLTKPVFNNDGNLVSNKFDFADTETKREHKKKIGSSDKEISQENNVSNHVNEVKNTNMNNNINSDRGLCSNVVSKQTDKKKHSLNYRSESLHIGGNYKSNIKPELNIHKYTDDSIKSEPNQKGNAVHNGNSILNNKTAHQGLIFNKDNKMVFSKVFIAENNNKVKKKTDKNLKKILKKIRENSAKISEIEKEDREKAISLKEKLNWAAALKRASGEKVKDDPELLKKSITKEKHKKMRSQKKWQARLDHMQKEKEEKQKKRMQNIQAKKNEKKKQKMKKAIKKGRYVQV